MDRLELRCIFLVHPVLDLLTLSIDLSFRGESKIDPKEVLLSLRLDLEVGDSISSLGMSSNKMLSEKILTISHRESKNMETWILEETRNKKKKI